MFTDAATNGLGYILVQRESVKVNQERNGIWSIITCGSCSLTPAQTRYSIYDLELSAIAFACIKLHDFMADGLFFTIYTDHQSLQGMEG